MIKSICFLTTYQCNAQCDFCECGPYEKDTLSLNEIIRLINEAHQLGTVGQVVFSGGEPTLLKDDLIQAISHASQLGLLTRIVTNGSWGITLQTARNYLDKLIAAGLHEINISVDDLHQEWIKLSYVKNSFLACQERNFKCLIAHKQTKNSKITKSFLENYFGIELINYESNKSYTPEMESRLISTSVVIPVGRNEESINSDELLFSRCTHNCSSVLRDIVVGANGRFLPCCGIVTKNVPELTRNNLADTPLIEAIEEANNDLILNWIALDGPASIARFVQNKDPSIRFLERYVGICHICNEVLTRKDVRKVLHEHIDEVVDYVSLHRAFFEKSRSDVQIMEKYYC